MAHLQQWTYTPEPRTWCTRCGVHEAQSTLCPVCTDKVKDSDVAAKMASLCRG